MQVTRSMFLNNKPAPASLAAASRCDRFRLRGLCKIALLRILLQRCTATLRTLCTLLLEIASQFTRKLLHFRKYGFEEIAGVFYTCDCFFGCEEKRLGVQAVERVGNLLPRNRQRDIRPVSLGAQRIDAHSCFVFGVLTPIDKNFFRSQTLWHLPDDQAR